MIRGFRALPFRRKAASERDQPPESNPTAERARRRLTDDLALDDAPVGPFLLMPSATYRQEIYDPAPVWAHPRSAAPPEPVAERVDEPTSAVASEAPDLAAPAETGKPKPATRTRKAKASASATQASDGDKPRRTRKPRADRPTT